MIGPKKLKQIRREIQQAIAETGKDPIQWLEERMSREQAKTSEILTSLGRLLKASGPGQRATKRSTSKS